MMTKRKINNQPAKTKHSETNAQQLRRREIDLEAWVPAPGNLVRRFRDEMDRLFQDFGFENLTRSLPGTESLGLGLWSPQIEMFEREGEIMVRADLPGLSREDITIDLTDSAMTIEGERKQEYEETDSGYYRSERSYGRFHRRIPLPEGIDIETANAQFRDGVLTVSFAMPERKERKTRKIEISDSSVALKAKAAGR